MARLRLRDTETRASRLPEVCMACGAPATSNIKKHFSWYPPWAGLLVLVAWPAALIAILILTKRMTVDVPVCDRHRGYFGKRVLWTCLVLLLCFGIPAAICAGGMGVAQRPGDEPTFAMASIFSFVLLLIVAVVIIATIQNKSLRPKEITDRDITLVCVDDRFVDAMEEMRDERRGMSRRDWDDDYESRRPRRAESEEGRSRGSEAYRAEPREDEPRRRDERIRGEPPDE